MGVLPGNMGEWSGMLLSVDGIKVCAILGVYMLYSDTCYCNSLIEGNIAYNAD